MRALVRPADQRALDAAVLVAERDLQVEDLLAVALEAEVARLDDAGVHRADRDLVDLLALDPVEVGHAGGGAASAVPAPGVVARAVRRMEADRLEPRDARPAARRTARRSRARRGGPAGSRGVSDGKRVRRRASLRPTRSSAAVAVGEHGVELDRAGRARASPKRAATRSPRADRADDQPRGSSASGELRDRRARHRARRCAARASRGCAHRRHLQRTRRPRAAARSQRRRDVEARAAARAPRSTSDRRDACRRCRGSRRACAPRGGSPWTTREDRRAHADEDDAEQQQEQAAATTKLPAADRGVQDGELAHERAERRRAGDREEAGEEQRRRDAAARRSAPRTSSVELAADRRGGCCRRRGTARPWSAPLLIRCSSAPNVPRAADADAEHQDAHVLDAGVGEHALEVALPRP